MKKMYKREFELIQDCFNRIKFLLSEQYPNILFHISPTGEISCWVKGEQNTSGAAIVLKRKMNACYLGFGEFEELERINSVVELAATKPKDFFYCTECGATYPRSQYGDFVMASEYCKTCAKKRDIAAMIALSHTVGFYD